MRAMQLGRKGDVTGLDQAGHQRRRTLDAVHEGGGVAWEAEVDHVISGNIQTTSEKVGADQNDNVLRPVAGSEVVVEAGRYQVAARKPFVQHRAGRLQAAVVEGRGNVDKLARGRLTVRTFLVLHQRVVQAWARADHAEAPRGEDVVEEELRGSDHDVAAAVLDHGVGHHRPPNELDAAGHQAIDGVARARQWQCAGCCGGARSAHEVPFATSHVHRDRLNDLFGDLDSRNSADHRTLVLEAQAERAGQSGEVVECMR
ncbi:phosphate acetyltransferase [Babesia caballi]|uniref:Phosphate acetyltransferase n=1 Tax=Babesia caballi TaxID=5871 RepID=A0AAV4LLU4_BABCB|nr:phosphate acetyltransferase [Babesia caballi]